MPSQIEQLVQQFERTRLYTRMVLAHTDRTRWCDMPPGCPTHVTWEVGHIAWAQWFRGLRDIGGQSAPPFSQHWLELFSAGSVPSADARLYPTPDELLMEFERTFELWLSVLRNLPEPSLSDPMTHPTGLVQTKLDMIYFLMRHESIHTGHIALIRRLNGAGPYR